MPRPYLNISWSLAVLLTVASPATAQETGRTAKEIPLHASAQEWLSYGGDYAETRYSTLDQIHTGNVHRLGLAWAWEIGNDPGQLEATPIVADGVLYATATWSVVFALDARTGEVLWRWDPGIVRGGRAAGGPSVCCGPVNRGAALHGDKLFVGLLDGRLVALDTRTGTPVWTRQTTPLGEDYSITGAPRVINDMVVIGNSGAEFGVRGYITAYDAETGNQLWRFYTVPGDPSKPFESPAMEYAAQTWTGEWWRLGGGGTVWNAYAFDPDADLLYVGVGNGSPWSRDHRSPGGGDNLFVASIVALRPADGELVWYYQTSPGDDWDYTSTQDIILADVVIDGQERKILMHAPKNGFFYVIDRLTGELLSAEPFVHVNWATRIDLETGRPVETPAARYGLEGTWISPGPQGAHSWHPMSWNPNTGLVYLPGQNTSFFFRREPTFDPQPGTYNLGVPLGGGGPQPSPEVPGPAGFLLARDPVTQEDRWIIPLDTRFNGGTITTAGNLVFSGTSNGWFRAHDAETGEQLWEFEVGNGPASPVTYELDGVQYVSILAGRGGNAPPGRVWTFVLDGRAPRPE